MKVKVILLSFEITFYLVSNIGPYREINLEHSTEATGTFELVRPMFERSNTG